MNRDQFGAVGKGRLDLNVGNHFGNAVHDLVGAQHMCAGLHKFGDAAAISRALNDEIGDKRDRFGMVELDPRSKRRRATWAAMAISNLSFSRGVRFIAVSEFLLASAGHPIARRAARHRHRGMRAEPR